jgi:hypothetical protein
MRARQSLPIGVLLLGVLTVAGGASAQVRKKGEDALSRRAFISPKLALTQPIVPYSEVAERISPAVADSWQRFRADAKDWAASVDRRTGAIAFASGSGIPWSSKPEPVNSAALEQISRDFLRAVAPMLGVNPNSLVLDLGRSTQITPGVWFIDFNVLAEGTPIEGARVLLRFNNGKLIQFGSENLPSAGATPSALKLGRDQALSVAARHVDGFTDADTFRDYGSLHLIPIDLNADHGKEFSFGKGRGVARVWQFVFERRGIVGTFRARVDATTGELLEFQDINRYAQATGGIYANTPATGPEVVRPFPYADLSTGGYANSAGLYNYAGGALSSTLNGKYVAISDTCGSVALAADGSGNLVFGTSAGTDCTTPGFGGAGNTHAAREQFYQNNRVMELARGWLPSNTWLTQQLPVNVNLTGTCNAFWNPGPQNLNFYQAFGGCQNTGEYSSVSVHELGHGLDQNDGNGFSPDGGTGEAVADITAFMVLHDSCLGPGILPTSCGGYGDACTSCSGFRDVDWGKHASNTPHTVANFSQINCNIPDYPGMCGVSAHCESYIATEAVWDLVNRDLPNPGSNAAWAVGERLFFSSRPTQTAAFTCNTASATWTSNGCNAGSLWEVFRALDDDDGNLANGTPHGGALFAAFDRHGIACASDPGASTTFSGCTAPPTPHVKVKGRNKKVKVSWNASAGTVYDVYRNEAGCNAGFTKIASLSADDYTDHDVANGTTYYYQVIGHPPANPACASPPSSCRAVKPKCCWLKRAFKCNCS